ncbi:MAG: sulfotransferase family 2 domain-containing protein [Lentibacter algarum]
MTKASGVRSLGHQKLSQVEGEEFFACVRNPYDRACSLYWFILGRQKFMPFQIAATYKTLTEFWQTIGDQAKPHSRHIARPQVDFIRDKHGEGSISSRIKHLLRFETLAEEWPAFAAKYGYKELPHENKSERPATWQEEMTPELIEIINEKFADDFEHLNYERIS